MSIQPQIELRRVGMCFRLYLEKTHTLKETVINMLRGRNSYRDLWALRGVDLTIMPGQSVGIIGRNGSGKSTLLKIVSGVFAPTEGTRLVNGSVAALIELGAGFNGELTGRENVFLGGAIMGLSRGEMMRRYERIVAFAELHDFMDAPLKNYSSGMHARLGFAVATDVDADILVIDEVLAVGDEAFQSKCLARIREFLNSGRTLVFVSHDATMVEQICQRAILLDGGRLIHDGPTVETLVAYRALLQRGDAPRIALAP